MNIEKSARFEKLDREIKGRVYTDGVSRIMYATDASPYKENPMAVVVPEEVEDLKRIVAFAGEEKIPIIPRGAGTSLAGQVVGGGIVVDLSRHFSRILELNVQDKWVKVQPGIILNELNRLLKPHGLFFGPETSTASRCTLGGMLGNNSCGLHSVIYGSTRDHTLEVDAILS
ncbi:MAG: FAD-binding oxidoreductase, partial [Proteobacteria bacterium]|nr:FAD-binding oxidoreductase [Pseudomonadota bacterium]